MTEEDSDLGTSLQLESKQALLPRAETIREAICGQNGLLAWACFSTFLVFVFGVTLVRPLICSGCPMSFRDTQVPTLRLYGLT